jgi:hypothetical protein
MNFPSPLCIRRPHPRHGWEAGPEPREGRGDGDPPDICVISGTAALAGHDDECGG